MNKYISDNLLKKDDIKRIGVDLDDTIAQKIYPLPGIGDPIPGAREALQALQDAGYKIIIYTARADADEISIEKWCKDFNIPYDKIRCAKPLFKMYIGDEAFRFSGDWEADLPGIKQILGERANT